VVSLAAMRYLLLSDIHGNDVALEAVLRDAGKRRWEKVLFLGDLVGYYTAPEKVARLLIDLDPLVCLLGNHDQLLLDMAAGRAVPTGEAEVVTEVVARHLEALSPESLGFVRSFTEAAMDGNWQAVHGALRHPWEYINSLQSAQANLPLMQRPLCFVGHTHVPRVFASVQSGSQQLWRMVPFHERRTVYRIPPRAKVLFNPGSVGQPRDGSPLASYAIYDDEQATVELLRVEFDVLAVQRSVREHDYPEMLAVRLAVGR
jgi:predicted phosphodiesterase